MSTIVTDLRAMREWVLDQDEAIDRWQDCARAQQRLLRRWQWLCGGLVALCWIQWVLRLTQ